MYLYASIYLQSVLGLSAIEAGLVFVPSTLVMVVVSGATAQLGQKVHPGVLISGGLILVAAGMALMTVAQVDSSWTALLPGITVALIGTGLFNPSVSAVALSSVPGRPERPRRRHQRHVPPGRHRDRRRRPRRADPHRQAAARRLGRRLRRRHAHGAARRRGPRRARRDRGALLMPRRAGIGVAGERGPQDQLSPRVSRLTPAKLLSRRVQDRIALDRQLRGWRDKTPAGS